MKKNMLLQMVAAALFSLALAACGGGHQHDHGSESTQSATTPVHSHEQGPEYTSAYICPMHCEGSGSDQPGQCPACGMDYVALAEHTKDGHSHD